MKNPTLPLKRPILFLFTLLCAAVASLQIVHAATITVTSTSDSGTGTLRQALAAAGDGDTIDFNLTYPATITLTSGQLNVDKNVTISGPGANNLAVNGNARSRVFHIALGRTATIAGLSITNGHANFGDDVDDYSVGGGIFNEGTLAVNNCSLSGNSASDLGGGICNIATLAVNNCTISGNRTEFTGGGGGGIFNVGPAFFFFAETGQTGDATLSVTNSILSGNTTGNGGGIFNFAYFGNATVTVTNSAISDNRAQTGSGGGIFNSESNSFNQNNQNATLTVTDSIISGNQAEFSGGGIANWDQHFFSDPPNGGATLTVTNSTIRDNQAREGNGGGIYNHGNSDNATATVTVSNSTMSDNLAALAGGGIDNDGNSGSATLTITNSTLSGNQAFTENPGLISDGGGIRNTGQHSGSASLTLTNSTLSGNKAGRDFWDLTGPTLDGNGGGIANNGSDNGSATATVTNSTISGNSANESFELPINESGRGFAIYNSGVSGSATLTITNSTIYGNFSHFSHDRETRNDNAMLTVRGTILGSIFNTAGTVTSLGYNLFFAGAFGFSTAAGDQTSSFPMLGPLQDNGGPTFTHALLPGSPAIDMGKNFSGSTTDQRGSGYARTVDNTSITSAPGGDGTDIGAFEVHGHNFTVMNTNDSGSGSLRSALVEVRDGDTMDFDTIDFDASVTGTITLTSGELLVNKTVAITGPGADQLSVNGNHASRVFHIASGKTVSISGLRITNGSDIAGGGVYNDHGNLTVGNCTISGNSASTGGGIHNDDGLLFVNNSTLSGNSAGAGGGIDNDADEAGVGRLFVNNSTLSGNAGGGINNDADDASFAVLVVRNSTLSGNAGGSIYNASATTSVAVGSTILNTGGSGESIPGEGFGVDSLGYNVSSDNGGGFLTAAGDQINTDPMLGPLQDNGGPIFTHALLPGSPAIDMGNNFSGSTTDQRGSGYDRTVDNASIVNATDGDGTDIGAFEVQAAAYVAQIQQPIDADGTSVFNVRRGVVPVRFTLTLDGVATCDLPAATIGVYRTGTGGNEQIGESVYTGPADAGSNFRIDSCQYVYNLSASALGAGTYQVDILINGQVVGSATFTLR